LFKARVVLALALLMLDVSACGRSSSVMPGPVATTAADQNGSSSADNEAVVIRPPVIRPGQPYAVLRFIRRRVTSAAAAEGAWDGNTADACPNWQAMPCLVQTVATNSYQADIDCNGNTDCAKTTYAPYLIPLSGFTATFTPASYVPPTVSNVNVTADTTVKPGMSHFNMATGSCRVRDLEWGIRARCLH